MGVASNGAPGAHAENRVESTFHSPPSEFDGCFTTFYHLDLDVADGTTIKDYLQPEWGNIRFFCGAAPTARIADSAVRGARFCATGPSSLPCHFEAGTATMWGIGFLPLGWARFMDVDARAVANVVCDGATHPAFVKYDVLSDVLCEPGITIAEQKSAILEIMGRLMRPSRDEAKIFKVHTALVDGTFTSVGDLAQECSISIRTLERVCSRYFGFTPKLLMRRQRFMRSLTAWMLNREKRWTEAMDGHYHDQAQFTREFHQFMTMNPSEYAAIEHPILSSFMEARARVWGSAAQTLDKPSR